MHDMLHKLKERIVQGKGFLKNSPVSIFDFHLASTGAVLTTTLTTNPGRDKTDTNFTTLSWAADKVITVGLNFIVPDDYDPIKDHLKLKLKAVSAGATNTPTFDAVLYKDDDATTDLDPTISAALSATLAWVEIDCSDQGLEAGDCIHIQVTPSAHSTDAINVYGAKWEYRSTLVYADRSSTR